MIGRTRDGQLTSEYLAAGSSFTDFAARAAPNVLPSSRTAAPGLADLAPHGTTIVAIASAEGVVMAGDRRATMGNLIASRDIEKVHPADAYSLIGIAGTAGIGIELMRLFQVELEHYEKIEGAMLSLDGKANRLAAMVRGNLGAAMQGLAVVPLFAGFDLAPADPSKAGRIFSFDVAGGLYEETGYDAIGSGSLFAKSALKKKYRTGVSTVDAVELAVEALYDAADDDTATGGPDLTRHIYPVVVSVTGTEGAMRRPEAEIEAVVRAVVADRTENPGG